MKVFCTEYHIQGMEDEIFGENVTTSGWFSG